LDWGDMLPAPSKPLSSQHTRLLAHELQVRGV
jgi:hypothetical protein